MSLAPGKAHNPERARNERGDVCELQPVRTSKGEPEDRSARESDALIDHIVIEATEMSASTNLKGRAKVESIALAFRQD